MMNMAMVRLYAATTHWTPDSPAENSAWMSGRATFTMVASRKIMNRPRPVATSTPGWLSGPDACAMGGDPSPPPVGPPGPDGAGHRTRAVG